MKDENRLVQNLLFSFFSGYLFCQHNPCWGDKKDVTPISLVFTRVLRHFCPQFQNRVYHGCPWMSKPENRIKATSRSVFLRSENGPAFFMHKNDSCYLPPLAPRAVPALTYIYFPAVLSLQNTWEQSALFSGGNVFCLSPSHTLPQVSYQLGKNIYLPHACA